MPARNQRHNTVIKKKNSDTTVIKTNCAKGDQGIDLKLPPGLRNHKTLQNEKVTQTQKHR